MSTTASTVASPVRRRLVRLATVASLFALPLGVGAVALAGAAAAAEPSTVHDADSRAVDALGGLHSDGFADDGSYDPHAQIVWLAAGERFTEDAHDGCNPYTFIYGGVETSPGCPVGQARADWNVDFVKDAWQQSGIRTYTISNADLSTFRAEGAYTPRSTSYVPADGDAIFWGTPGGADHTVGVVLEATSTSHVKVVIGDVDGALVTEWVDVATSTVGGEPVTGFVTPTYNG